LYDTITHKCDALLSIVVNTPAGAKQLPCYEHSNNPLVAWEHKLEWLKHRLMYFQSFLQEDKDVEMKDRSGATTDLVMEEDALHIRISELQEELKKLNDKRLHDKLLLQRVTEHPTIAGIIYPQQEQTQEDLLIKTLFIQRDDKVTEFLTLHETTKKRVQEERFKLHKEIIDLKRKSRELWKINIQNKKQNQPESSVDEEELQKFEETLQRKDSHNTILRNVFQALIVESGVNWAKDPELREIFLSLSTPPWKE